MIHPKCHHCGVEVERISMVDSADHNRFVQPRWRDGRGNFRCVGAIHHRPDLPPGLTPDVIREWLEP